MSSFLKKTLLVTVWLLCSEAVSFAVDLKELSSHPKWQALLHYHNGKSLIKDSKFFISPIGVNSPYEELKATASIINDHEKVAAFNCQFPARSLFLTEHGIPILRNEKCAELQTYIDNIAIKDISVVFATEKTSSPTSMMGHMFLKLNGEKEDHNPQHSLSFFANLSEISSIHQFFIESLITGTNGLYILEPYKNKVESYVHKETRKLIEYPLNLSKADLKFFTAHIWEMKGVNVEYNLNDQNCASALITLLSVLNPTYKDLAYKPYITPTDLINQMISKNILEDNHNYTINKTGSMALKSTLGSDSRGGFLQLKFMPAYNDLMSNNNSYDYEADVDLFGLDIKIYDQGNALYINELNIMRAKSYKSAEGFSKAIDFGFESEHLNEASDLFPRFQFGLGKGKKYEFLHPYAFVNVGAAYYDNSLATFIAPELGLFVNYADYAKTHLSFHKYYNNDNYKYNTQLKAAHAFFIQDNVNMHIEYKKNQNSDHENESLSLGFSLHF